jgi:hypothetical protein
VEIPNGRYSGHTEIKLVKIKTALRINSMIAKVPEITPVK